MCTCVTASVPLSAACWRFSRRRIAFDRKVATFLYWDAADLPRSKNESAPYSEFMCVFDATNNTRRCKDEGVLSSTNYPTSDITI